MAAIWLRLFIGPDTEVSEMAAYLALDLTITDPEGFQQYREGVIPLLEKAGARLLFVAGDAEALEGDWTPASLAVFEFPSREALREMWDSAEYQRLKVLRHKTSTAQIAVLQSLNVS